MSRSALPVAPHTKAAAQFLPLSQEEWREYQKHLEVDEKYEPYELAGCIGVRQDLLEKTLKISTTLQRVARSIFCDMQSNRALRGELFRALRHLPITKIAAETSPFFLNYLRVDFFLDPNGEDVKIIEMNSSGAGLTDYLPCIDFLKNFHSFKTPTGSKALTMEIVLSRLINYCTRLHPDFRTLGLVAVENGCTDYREENGLYGEWLRKNTDIIPVYMALRKGELSLLDHPDLPNTITDLSKIDGVFVDFFEDLECLERVQKQLDQLGVVSVPPRSDILFENKHFLSILQTIQKPSGIADTDWGLLQDALLPSFPLEEYETYLSVMQEWDGIVLKMDIDCCGENVHLFDFSIFSFEEVQKVLKEKKKESEWNGATYTIQKMITPPHIPMGDSPRQWTGIDYTPYKYDLMTYLCLHEETPHVLFGSRCFSRDKVDELTEEGRRDCMGTPICMI
jgi:hypothetical protein